MVLIVWAGVSSTITGAIRRVKSGLGVSDTGTLDCRLACICDMSNLAVLSSIAATPPNFTKSLRFTIPSRLAATNPGACQSRPRLRQNPLMPKSRVQEASIGKDPYRGPPGATDEILSSGKVLGPKYSLTMKLRNHWPGWICLGL